MRRCLLVPLVVLFAANLAAQGQSAPKAGQSAPKASQSVPKAGPPAQQAGADAQTQTKNLAEYAELLRSDVRAQKVAIITDIRICMRYCRNAVSAPICIAPSLMRCAPK